MSEPVETTGLEIAIIGMAGRFPGASDVDALWANLLDGVESIQTFTAEQLRAAGVSPDLLDDPNYVRAGGVLDSVDRFDAGFFGYSPREAALMDPQQRVFLETAWAAMEHAGYAPGATSAVVGVYAGMGPTDYLVRQVLGGAGGQRFDHQAIVANDKDFLASRVAYKLNLQGPALVVQTACSTSLVAVHVACQALLAGDCDMALAGGVTIRVPHGAGYLYQEDGIASPDGHCRAFSAGAQGCVPGNGSAVVVLKPLARAQADRDCIHAVIKGTAINNDGSHKVGYTAPGVEGQRQVIRAALAVAGVSADTIGYLEAHGTGTLIGDPIEVEAASRAFREDTARRGYCAIGSVKTNLGHLDAAAGVTGLVKAALAVKYGVVPPSLHGAPPNPRIDFETSPFFVNISRREWRPPYPRRAGVSAFGIGGTNAHAVVEQPPAVDEAVAPAGPELLVLSAKTSAALASASAALADRLGATPAPRLDDVAFTLRHGRAAFAHRRAVVARTSADAAARLREPNAAGETDHTVAPRVVFMFPGQGSQYAGMGTGLPASFAGARAELERCIGLARAAGVDLRPLLEAARGDAAADARLRETQLAQPAIFSLSYALARQLMEWGVQPAAMIGHSVGEYVAACLAGVMTLEDALAIVIERGRLTSALSAGAMAAVALDAGELARVLPPGVSLAAVNAPGRSVVSGAAAAVAPFVATLVARGVDTRPLHTSHAFHSEMMEPAVPPLVARVSAARLRAPQAPYVSNVTGTWITPEEAVDPAYYGRHLRGTVRFADGLAEILATPGTLLVEVGPGTALTTLARRHAAAGPIVALPTTPHPDEPGTAGEATLRTVGALWSAGVPVSWQRFDRASTARRVPLPSYPFARERHWLEGVPPGLTPRPASDASDEGRQADVAQWLSIPSWERVAPAAIASMDAADEARSARLRDAGFWLVLADARGVCADLARQLRAGGAEVMIVGRGARYDEHGDSCTINPADAAHYDRLAGALAARRPSRLQIVHGWTLDADGEIRRGAETLDDVYARGFSSLLSLARTLGDLPWLLSCRLTVLASHLHEVIGGEPLWPEKATVLGPCRTIPLEYPQFECLSLDVDPGDADAHDRARVVKLVIDTLLEPPGETLAIRGWHRWRQVMQPRPLGPVEGLPGFKPRGAYLIAGGLKGVGLALAEHLARTHRARLLLVGRTPLPPRPAWADAEGETRHGWAGDVLLEADREERTAFSSPDAQPADPGPAWAADVDRLCAAYAWRFFARAGVDAGRVATWDRAALRERCGVQPRFTRYFDALVRMLEEDGAGVSAPDVDALAAATRARHPSMAPLLDVLRTCADAMNDSLTGAAFALEPLFGDAHYDAFQRGVRTVRAHSFVPACERLVAGIVSKLRPESGRPLRILEVGGGEGLLTQVLLPLLAGRNVEYHFTDIGRAFVAGARRRAESAGQRFVRADVLDISRPPGEQGFEGGAYDVVLAFNVLHATPDVVASLRHARQLLAPGGLLLLQESTRPARWIDLIWGLTDGWWAFEDTTRRTTSPLLGLEAWERALAEAGFERPTAYPRAAADRARTDTGVIAGIQPGSAARTAAGAADGSVAATLQALRRIEQAGGEVEVVTADVADTGAMRTAIARAEERWGRLDGVVHGALVLNDGTIRAKTLDAAKVVFHPKIDGTLALTRALDGRPLDLFVLFSSLVSTISGPGQVDYCAASAFQDAFALAEQGRLARRVVAIDWAGWRDVGKAYRSAVERGASPDAAVPNGMTVAEGLDALGRALATGAPQVIVSPERLDRIRDRRREGGSESAPEAPKPTAAGESPAAAAAAAAVNEVERVIAAIWSEVLGVSGVGAQDNFFDLGGDSVLSLQFVAQAKKAGFKLTSKQVFEHQTVEALAAVAQPLGKDGGPKDGPGA